jgi:glycosyltransferase involved in cell wall biosynthesis
MKGAIYNPYWDTLGGGERYTISFAKVLTELGYSVDIEWKDAGILGKIEERFGIKLNNVNFVESVRKGEGYDVCFWISDGSIPLLHSRLNILHFQVPFVNVNGDSLINRMKMYRIKSVICNSNFTKKVIDNEYKVNSLVVYPPCDTSKIKSKRKENVILSVGRFSQLLQAKHQDVLLDAFVKMTNRGLNDWKLLLVGGSDVGSDEFLKILRRKAEGYPIEIIENPDYKKLVYLYGTAKIFWSASGYGEDEKENPKKVEHFGISLVEAMAAGCTPVVYNAGGFPEIVEHGKNGMLWKSENELVRITKALISDGKNLRSLSKEAVKRSKDFNYERFKEAVEKILQ